MPFHNCRYAHFSKSPWDDLNIKQNISKSTLKVTLPDEVMCQIVSSIISTLRIEENKCIYAYLHICIYAFIYSSNPFGSKKWDTTLFKDCSANQSVRIPACTTFFLQLTIIGSCNYTTIFVSELKIT